MYKPTYIYHGDPDSMSGVRYLALYVMYELRDRDIETGQSKRTREEGKETIAMDISLQKKLDEKTRSYPIVH